MRSSNGLDDVRSSTPGGRLRGQQREYIAVANEPGKKQRRLGRGLSALMQPPVPIEVNPPKSQVPAHESRGADDYRTIDVEGYKPGEKRPQRVVFLPLGAIHPSPFQPRTSFDEAELKQLADSIREAGVIQPVLVRAVVGGPSDYELIAGERRWRAAEVAGIEHIPALVVSLGDEQAAEWALVENLQRTDLNTMERARALRGLQERFGLAQADIAQRVGLDRSTVANLMRLTELEFEIQELIASGQLTAGHGKALLAIDVAQLRWQTAMKAAKEGWSVRRLEAYSRTSTDQTGVSASPVASPALIDLERRLSEHLGTRVRIRTTRDGTRGRLSLEFYSLDHFDGLMQRLQFDSSSL